MTTNQTSTTSHSPATNTPARSARVNAKLRRFGPLLGAAAIVIGAVATQSAQAAGSTGGPSAAPHVPERTVTLTGKAAVRVVPDRATITLGVVTRNDNVATAQLKNAASVRSMIAALEKARVPRTAISPGTFVIEETSVDASTESGRYETKYAYSVTTQVTVTMTDLSRVGEALRVAVDAGANRVNVEFGTSALRQARDQARTAAIKAAREKGRDMAAAAGVALGPVRSFAEASSWWGQGSTRNSVQNFDQRIADGAPAATIGDEATLLGDGPILVEAEVTVEIALAL